jgi:uncharacterized protein (TIGR01777 family)
VPVLQRDGYEVVRLVRRTPRAGEIAWDPGRGRIDAAGLEGLSAVVHLAGENLAGGRWTAARRRRILESRTAGTGIIARTLAALERPPAVLVSASAIGLYGDRGETLLDESSESGVGFLADVVRAWEGAADPARAAGIRVVHPRFGVVLSPRGGALAKLLIPFRLGLGAPLGRGDQWMSTVSIDDTAGAIRHAIGTGDLAGPMNVAMPEAVRNAELTRTLARVLRRPSLPFGVPAFALRAVLGQLADETLLLSTRVVPRRLVETGYQFQHPTLEAALRHVLAARAR